MLKPDVDVVFLEVARVHAPLHNLYYIVQRTALPPHGESIGNLDVLVTGEPEVNEPLAVEQTSSLLQQRNPPPIVLNQIIVGRRDVDHALLNRERGNP